MSLQGFRELLEGEVAKIDAQLIDYEGNLRKEFAPPDKDVLAEFVVLWERPEDDGRPCWGVHLAVVRAVDDGLIAAMFHGRYDLTEAVARKYFFAGLD